MEAGAGVPVNTHVLLDLFIWTPTLRPLAFRGPEHRDAPDHLPFSLHDYLELMDWCGRAVREDKGGAIPGNIPPILERLRIDPTEYLYFLRAERNAFTRAVGAVDRLRETARAIGQRYLRGIGVSQALYAS